MRPLFKSSLFAAASLPVLGLAMADAAGAQTVIQQEQVIQHEVVTQTPPQMTHPAPGTLLIPAAPAGTATTMNAAVAAPTVAVPGAREGSPISGLRWQPVVGGMVPPDALQLGVNNGRQVYACRGAVTGQRIGAVIAGEPCQVPADGNSVTAYEYEVLVGQPWMLRWPDQVQSLDASTAPATAEGQALPLCVVDQQDGRVTPGQLMNDGRCHVPYEGKELMARDFRVAVPNPSGDFSLRWVSGAWVPPGALTASASQGPAACLAQHGGQWLPGTVTSGGCTYAVGNSLASTMGYTVIIGAPNRVDWVPYRNGGVFSYPGDLSQLTKIGGYAGAGQPPIPVCRVDLNGVWSIGYESANRCIAPASQNQLASAESYDVLHYRQGPGETARLMPAEPMR